MKKAFLTTALALALSVALAAQTTPTASTTSQTPAPTSLTGCLSGGQNGIYTLRSLADGQVYTLRSANPLASHAGHAVTVTGSMDTSASVNTTTTSSGPAPASPSTGAATTPNTGAQTTPATGAAGTTAGTSNPAGMNPPTAGSTSAAGTSAPVSGGASAVFNVTGIAMANESCEAGSAALGTGTPTNSTTGVTTTGQSTTAGATGSTSGTSTTASGQNTPSTTGQTSVGATASQTTTAAGSANSAGEGETISGCLIASTRDQGRYFLRTTKGKKFVTEVIPSTEMATNFSDHVGHQVRLRGQFTDATARALDNSTGTGNVTAGNSGDTTVSGNNDTRSLPQSDQPERGKKAHENDRNTGRQFTATNVEMISASGCPQSSTAPNSGRAKRNRGTSGSTTPDQQR